MTAPPKLRMRPGRGPLRDEDTSAALKCATDFFAERHRLGYMDPSPRSSEGLWLGFMERYGDHSDRQRILERARNGCPDALALVDHHLEFQKTHPLPEWVLEYMTDAVSRRRIEKKPRAGKWSQRDNIIRRCFDFVMMGGMPTPEGGTSFRPKNKSRAAWILSKALEGVGMHMTPKNVEAIWRRENRKAIVFGQHLKDFNRRNDILNRLDQ